MAGWTKVAAAADIAEGNMLGVRVGDTEVAIYHLPGGDYRATNNVCTHEYALLTDGWLEDGQIECPLHAGRFDIKSGKAMSAPCERPIAVYDVKVEGGDLMVNLPG